MTKTGFFFDELCLWHTTGLHATTLPVGGWVQPPAGSGHAESPETKRRLKNLMDVSGLSKQLLISDASAVTEQDVARIHSVKYLRHFKEVSDNGGGMLGHNAPIGPGSYEIAKLSAGLAKTAIDQVLLGNIKNAYSLSRPPGHHCLPDEAMGFCFMANIPIAIEAAKVKHQIERVAIIDWDVHHGNGTQAIYEKREDVLTISIHQANCFPAGYTGENDRGKGKGRGYNYNIPLYPGTGHDGYLYALREIVIPALKQFKPELIVIACGFDANALDPLARMLLHSDSFREMTMLIKEAADIFCDGRLVMVHEGGYAESYVPFCGLATIEALSGIKTAVEDPLLEFIKLQQPDQDFCAMQRKRIDQLKQLFIL